MTPRSRKVCVGCRAGYFEKTVAFPFGRRRRQYSMEDMPMTSRLRFGVFLAPFHKPGINPTLALQNDLDLVAWLDRLGYDEAWFGEDHSAGTEISASPEIMIAVAAERTRHIKLGTGVVSLSYHNPLWVAERIVLLDHLTRGRAMFGAGPGSLPTDGIMIGVPQSETRELLEQSLDVIMRLLAGDEPVTFKNHRWDLRDARLHLRPYSNPLFRRGGGGRGVAHGGQARRTAWHRAPLGRRDDSGRLRCPGTALECAGRGSAGARQDGRPLELAPRRPDALRGNQGAGDRRRTVRHRALVPLLSGGCGLSANGRARRQRR